jgi:hypothetical protein
MLKCGCSDIDLTIATTKTLVRLRRDDLVRLCETRDLDVAGTKPQLASALLEWRDRQSQSGFSSPSSTGTIRAPDTIKRRRKSQAARLNHTLVPKLLSFYALITSTRMNLVHRLYLIRVRTRNQSWSWTWRVWGWRIERYHLRS